jgi:ADP-ribosylation factor 2-binding protein
LKNIVSSDDFDETDEHVNVSKDNLDFDSIVGELENILVDDEFLEKQQTFLQENSKVFTNDEENKLVYTEIFKKYVIMYT